MRFGFVILLALMGSVRTQANDPELIPLRPTPVAQPRIEDTTYLRTSFYARWQYYAVDQQGYFRPRVVLDFPEPYYLVNGNPYPLMPVMPRSYIAHIFD
jgi:hypothetical protein